ncbi:MAG: hypothetical protein ACLTNO_10835 [Blautia sp.]
MPGCRGLDYVDGKQTVKWQRVLKGEGSFDALEPSRSSRYLNKEVYNLGITIPRLTKTPSLTDLES